MTDWDALEAPLVETARFYIEPTDKDPANETARVQAFRKALRKVAPLLEVVAIPNAGARSQWAVNQAKREGARWGFPDLMVIGPSPKIAFLEFKAGKTAPADHQIVWLNRLVGLGYPGGVFRTSGAAIEWLRANGFPFHNQTGRSGVCTATTALTPAIGVANA
jgi:hypothetical protein